MIHWFLQFTSNLIFTAYTEYISAIHLAFWKNEYFYIILRCLFINHINSEVFFWNYWKFTRTMQISILIIEDDLLYAESIKVTLLESNIVVDASQIYIVSNLKDALLLITNNSPSLIICDIFLEGETWGLELLGHKEIEQIPVIMMTTSVDNELYLKAKKYRPINYLIKPIQKLSLISTVEKILFYESIQKLEYPETYILVRNNKGKYLRLHFFEIIYIESYGNYCTFILESNMYTIKYSLAKIIKKLNNNFVRCHQKLIINLKYVSSYDNKEIIMTNGKVLPIGKTYKDNFKDGSVF